ncbi:hypothetical protein [Halorubellus sp. PRR65]|uniref:hypothetical protein n=1 Tax=Halorubellus sp. PRR65 TaxID=3098148 RepID=UPI002B263AC9|nr:hypothetical protein [Halorubellus sp. PRR65]
MRRRALLAALTASASATAGCSLPDDSDRSREPFAVSDTTAEPTSEMTFEPPADGVSRGFAVPGYDDHRVAVTTPTAIPDDVAVTLGFTAGPTTEAPAGVYVRVQALPSADAPVELPVGSTPPLSAYRGVHETEDGGSRPMFLVPRRAGVEFDALVRRDQACWRPKLPVGPEDATTGTRTLSPGDAVEREYYLVTPWASDRCLQPGTYLFEADAGWRFSVCSFDREPPYDSAYADADVASLPGFEGTRWYHDADADTDLFLRPRSEQVGLPSTTARFTFRNQSYRRVRVDESVWALYKLVDDRWHPIAPLAGSANDGGERAVYPGTTSTLALSLHTDPDAPDDDDRRAVGGLGQGQYALAYPATLSPAGPSNYGNRPTAALFTVVGNPPRVDATGAVDHTTDRDGVRHLHTTADESAVATLHLERVQRDDAPDAAPLVTEQVLQRDALRNAIVELRAATTGVDAVVYHTEPDDIARTVAWIDPDGSGLTFTYDGDAYAMTYG